MSDYPSDVGHWERIEKSAAFVNPTMTLHLPTVVEDVCRALIDLNAALREAKAEAWDEGFLAGHETARAINTEYPDLPANPYRPRKEARGEREE